MKHGLALSLSPSLSLHFSHWRYPWHLSRTAWSQSVWKIPGHLPSTRLSPWASHPCCQLVKEGRQTISNGNLQTIPCPSQHQPPPQNHHRPSILLTMPYFWSMIGSHLLMLSKERPSLTSYITMTPSHCLRYLIYTGEEEGTKKRKESGEALLPTKQLFLVQVLMFLCKNK